MRYNGEDFVTFVLFLAFVICTLVGIINRGCY
nr:MAG TPA: hypothetical protein [Inoviridae sp.]